MSISSAVLYNKDFLSKDKPLLNKDPTKQSATWLTVRRLNLSRNNLITHFTENVICLRKLILTGTP